MSGAHTCRDAAHLERNGATAMAEDLMESFGLTATQVGALLAGQWSAYRHLRRADLWEAGPSGRMPRVYTRPTMTSLDKLGLTEPVPECCVDRRLTPDGEAVARVLARRAKGRLRR